MTKELITLPEYKTTVVKVFRSVDYYNQNVLNNICDAPFYPSNKSVFLSNKAWRGYKQKLMVFYSKFVHTNDNVIHELFGKYPSERKFPRFISVKKEELIINVYYKNKDKEEKDFKQPFSDKFIVECYEVEESIISYITQKFGPVPVGLTNLFNTEGNIENFDEFLEEKVKHLLSIDYTGFVDKINSESVKSLTKKNKVITQQSLGFELSKKLNDLKKKKEEHLSHLNQVISAKKFHGCDFCIYSNLHKQFYKDCKRDKIKCRRIFSCDLFTNKAKLEMYEKCKCKNMKLSDVIERLKEEVYLLFNNSFEHFGVIKSNQDVFKLSIILLVAEKLISEGHLVVKYARFKPNNLRYAVVCKS